MQVILFYTNTSPLIKVQCQIEHIAGERNARSDSLSRLRMSGNAPKNLITKIYASNELTHDINFNFPLSMSLIKARHDKDAKLQSILKQEKYKSISVSTFGNFEVHTLNSKVWVPLSL